MTTSPVKNSRPLRRQLLLSHLSVALVGLIMLGIALIATYDLRAKVIGLASESGPMAQASFQLLTGIRHSLASLRGWITLGDPRFLDGWREAWQEEIQPALDRLKNCPRFHAQDCAARSSRELQALLADLRESQWWVQDIVRTPGNEPARLLYNRDVEPSAANLHTLLAALFQSEKEQQGDPERKALLAQTAELQDAVSTARLSLRETLGTGGSDHEHSFRESLEFVRSRLGTLVESPLLADEQRSLLFLFQDELEVFVTLAREAIQLRQSDGWNIALRTMVQETDPLADRAMALAVATATQAQTRLEQEILAAQTATAITAWSLLLMIALMLVAACFLSRLQAKAIALPITSLAEATQQLAAGRLRADIPVSADNEIGELTRSFNTLRAAMEEAQEKSRETNMLLEKRVRERTMQLEAINRSLSREIVERNQTDHALRESEARLRAMARAIPDLVFVVDEEGCYREILAAGQDRTAVGNTPIRGKLLSEIHAPDMARFFLDIIHRALQTRQIQVAEYELVTASGRRWFESRSAPLDIRFAEPSPITTLHPQGDLFGPPELRRFTAKSAAIVVARDITQRKHAETQLRQAQKMQAIGQLTGGIAHDFNNLLAIIMGNLELLNEQLTTQPELYEMAQQALRATDRGAKLTQRLLAFSRRQPLLAQATDLNKLILGMLELMRRTLGANIRIETALTSDLDQILVDPAQFENALLNLVINARDAMPQGGRLTLTTTNTLIEEKGGAATPTEMPPGPYVMLAVTDTGVGMTSESLERAFEPFFTTKETGKGSGLGLSMVYGLVKQSNGHITIQSEPGRGTTVRLYLPRIAQSARAVTEPRAADASIQGRDETILVVEDDAEVRRFAVSALRGLGYQPLQAADAATALRVLETTPHIALLFTDIVMPGEMDGVRLAAEAQRRYPGLRVLLTSGYTEHASIDQAELTAAIEILTKPYRKADLGRKLRMLLDRDESQS
ncbi:MAG: ATP-binding protein [Candidatus Contendobacter sp.]|nr:ATP-binding protein [Candidatus Contendobacter sp.]MDS4059943.1 ATP-binding protein [Candidatus Contendobacter sp.]